MKKYIDWIKENIKPWTSDEAKKTREMPVSMQVAIAVAVAVALAVAMAVGKP